MFLKLLGFLATFSSFTAGNDVPTTIAPVIFAFDQLLQLNKTLLTVLPNFLSLNYDLEKLIEAAQVALDIPVETSSKSSLQFVSRVVTIFKCFQLLPKEVNILSCINFTTQFAVFRKSFDSDRR